MFIDTNTSTICTVYIYMFIGTNTVYGTIWLEILAMNSYWQVGNLPQNCQKNTCQY